MTAPRKPKGWPIRRHPRIAHLLPYLVGDSIKAILRAIVLGFRFIDQNGLATRDLTVWVLHWHRYRLQYPYVWTGRYKNGREVRVLVPRSWPRKFDALTDAQAARLRSRPRGGKRPRRADAHMVVAAHGGIIWCLESKGGHPWRQPGTLDRLVADAVRTDVVMVLMILTSGPGWQDIARMAAERGLAVAVLPRTRKPDDWPALEALGVQAWGRWRRR
jgi:hypothetical protein